MTERRVYCPASVFRPDASVRRLGLDERLDRPVERFYPDRHLGRVERVLHHMICIRLVTPVQHSSRIRMRWRCQQYKLRTLPHQPKTLMSVSPPNTCREGAGGDLPVAVTITRIVK